MRVVRIIALLGFMVLVGCSEDCPRCQEPKIFPINFGGKCVKTRSDPRCEGYVPRLGADPLLRPRVLCQGAPSSGDLIGVWDSEPAGYGKWVGEVRRIQGSQGTSGAFGPGVPLCPDLIPGRSKDQFTALSEATAMRVTGWGYSSELSRYWVTGTSIEND